MNFCDNCRLCRELCDDKNFHFIQALKVDEIFSQIFPIDFSDSKFPQKVCQSCFGIAESANELRKTAIESDLFYKSALSKDPVRIKEEIEKDPVEVKFLDENFEIQSEVKNEPEIQLEEDLNLEFGEIPISNEIQSKVKILVEELPTVDEIPALKPQKSKRKQNLIARADPPINESLTNSKIFRLDYENPFNPRKSAGSENLHSNFSFYDCNFCNERLRQKSQTLRHMKILHDPKLLPFACKKCVRRFQSEFDLNFHARRSHGMEDGGEVTSKNVLECDLCGVTGNNKIGMENHLIDDHLKPRQATKKKISEDFKCDACALNFADSHHYDLHFMEFHKGLVRSLEPHEIEIDLSCCFCDEAHESAEELIEHTKTHKRIHKSTHCKICDRNVYNIAEHAEYHLQEPTHKCLECDKNFKFSGEFLVHMRRHRGSEKGIKCPECEVKLRSRKDFKNHFLAKHKNQTLFICPTCAKNFATNNRLENHIKFVHNKDQEIKFRCKFCPKTFCSRQPHLNHEATHSTQRPHVCEICGSAFKTLQRLKSHIKRVHEEKINKHSCSECEKAFPEKHQLATHMVTHTGEKSHACKFCDRSYGHRGDLTKHLRKMHVGDSIYQCKKCPKAFGRIVELREHQADHLN